MYCLPWSLMSSETHNKYRIRAFFDWNGGGPTLSGKLIMNGKLVTEGIRCQKGLFESICSWLSTMFCGGGLSSSISSVARLRKTDRLFPTISSKPRRSMDILAISNVLLCRILSASSTVICTVPSIEPPPTNMPADRSTPRSIRGCRCVGNSRSSLESGSRVNVLDGMRRWVSWETESNFAATWRNGDCEGP